MQHQVFVQVVTTYWTKASRAAPFSRARNLSPDAFEISDDEVDQLLAGERFSRVVLHERDGFKPRCTVETFLPLNRWRWGAVEIKVQNNDGVIVRYKHASWHGAPDRSHQPVVNYELSPDKRLRVTYNYRDSWPEGEWWYHMEVFNVLRTENPTTEMFLAEPAKCISDLAELW